MNILQYLLEKYPDKDWNWETISQLPDISFNDIKKHLDWPWDWNNGVSYNPNLTLEWLESFPDKDWSWETISNKN